MELPFNHLIQNGFQIIENIYTPTEINELLQQIEKELAIATHSKKPLFAQRFFLKNHPQLLPFIFNKKLLEVIHRLSPKAKIIKSIYFDKPPTANWVVQWHQDLTIHVNGKTEAKGYKNWRVLKDRTVVQPPLDILENIFTIRIHLDDCTSKNGALRVVPISHRKGVIPVKKGIENYLKRRKFVK